MSSKKDGCNWRKESKTLTLKTSSTIYVSLDKTRKEKRKLVIGEYNILWGTTSELNRYKTQELFGIIPSGWCGKYFPSLDTSDNDELVELALIYAAESQKKWNFTGSGIVLSNRKKVVVLQNEIHLNDPLPVISVNDTYAKQYGLPSEMAFCNWFEVNTLQDSITAMAIFQIKLSREGQAIFEELGIPASFAAVSAYTQNGQNLFYFSGDFSNNKVVSFYSRLANSRKALKLFTRNEQKLFFQNFYFPLIENILLQYSTNTKL